MIAKDGKNLSDDLTGREIAFHSKQGSKAELTIHRAPDLAGNTNRGPSSSWTYLLRAGGSRLDLCWVPPQFRQLLGACLGTVTCFTKIAFRHPHRLDRLAIGEGNQVADGPVYRSEFLLDSGQSNGDAFLCETGLERQRQVRNFCQGFSALAEDGVGQLARAEAGLAQVLHKGGKLLIREA
jgi:hypothetical protein